MSHWNHRVMRRVYPNDEVMYQIYEVFYNADGSIWGFTNDPVDPCGETVEEVRESLERMLRALDRPVLDWHDQSTDPREEDPVERDEDDDEPAHPEDKDATDAVASICDKDG